MSHFTVLACLDDSDGKLASLAAGRFPDGVPIPLYNPARILRHAVEERLEPAMAPFSEELEVAPYREYEDGEPEDNWLYRWTRKAAENQAAGEAPGSDSERQAQEDAAVRFAALPDPVTWADIAVLVNEHYHNDEDDRMLVDENGRAYQMSTWNKQSTWDYWRIGGRWGGYFPFRMEHRALVIQGDGSYDTPAGRMPDHCDGGQKAALDLPRLVAEKSQEARVKWASYQQCVAGTPAAISWAEFRKSIESGAVTPDQAREEYHSQPRVLAIRADSDFRWYDDAVGMFDVPEKEYVAGEAARAVPGYALLTLDGRWLAPGKMGWWGISSESDSEYAAYLKNATAYIGALPDSAFIIALDCHV